MKSWVEVSAATLAKNFRATQAAAGSEVEVLAVVKADGYGHGAALCAPVLRGAGARWLGVTDAEEGIAVRAALGESDTRILVMCGCEPSDAAELVAHALTPVVWTAEHIDAMEHAARAAGKRTRVHVEVDTGMGRQGAAVGRELADVARRIAASPWVLCEGVMAHLCSAEVAGAESTALAQKRFDVALGELSMAELIIPEYVGIGNTSAVDEGSTMAWIRDVAYRSGARVMVRTGLALYGYCLELQETENRKRRPGQVEHEAGRDAVHVGLLRPRVQPALTWKAPVIGLREVQAGATVGYGATFVAEKPMHLALLPVGYADGFRRDASSGLGDGWVMVNGQRAAVAGRVSMNLTVVDVTGIDGVAQGTEAVLLGEGVSAEDHARWARTIPYDILCGIRARRVLL